MQTLFFIDGLVKENALIVPEEKEII